MKLTFKYATEEEKRFFNNVLLDLPDDRNYLGIHGWEEKVFENNHYHICVVAIKDNELIGFGSVVQPDETGFAYIENLFILPSYLKNGYGIKLLKYIEDYARYNWVGRGVDIFTNENDPMEKLLKKAGFKFSGVYKDRLFRYTKFISQSRWYKIYKERG